MYTPEKVSRKSAPSANSIPRGRVAIVDNRPSQLRQIQLMEEIRSSATAAGSASGVAQMMFTRSQLKDIVDGLISGIYSPNDLSTLEDMEQYLVLSALRDRGYTSNFYDEFLSQGDGIAEEDSDIDHPDTSNGVEYGPGTAIYEVLQYKRGPGPSGPKDVPPYCTGVTYTRDASGNIDFGTQPIIKPGGSWQTPVKANSKVDLSEDVINPNFGKLSNGNLVQIPGASRSQHFSIANRIAKKHGQTHGTGGNSPTNWTWHHLLDKYKMHLVYYPVHQKFGHNGGFYFW